MRSVVVDYFDRVPGFPKALIAAVDAKKDPVLEEDWVPGLTRALLHKIEEELEARGSPYERRGEPEDCQLEADLLKSWAELYQDEGRAPAD